MRVSSSLARTSFLAAGAVVSATLLVALAPAAFAQRGESVMDAGLRFGAGAGTAEVLFEPRNLPGAERYENIDVPYFRAHYILNLESNGSVRVRGEVVHHATDEVTVDHSFTADAITPFILEANLFGATGDAFWIGGGIHVEDMTLTRFNTGDVTTCGYTAIQFNLGLEFGEQDDTLRLGGSIDMFLPIDAYAQGPGLDGFVPAASIDYLGGGSPEGDPNEEVNDPYFGFGVRVRVWASLRINPGMWLDFQIEAAGFDLAMVSEEDPLAPVTPGTERLLVFSTASSSVGVRIALGG